MEILVVEDDQSTRWAFGEILRLLGYTPYLTASCEEAVPIIESRPIRAAILDYWLASQNTCAPAAQALRERHIPYMVATAWNGPENLAKSVGANSFLKKPFDIEDLDQELRRLIVIPGYAVPLPR